VVKTIREFFNKNFDAADVRKSIIAAISIKVMEPIFESQTKTKLGSVDMGPDLQTIRTFVNDFIKTRLDNYLHKNPTVADAMLKKILQAERERKELSGIKKLARDRAKKSSVHNKKLRDCRVHYGDHKAERQLETTIFITEGDSASGSITKSRDVNTQAVFSLKGKPLNSYGLTKKIVYENEEFNLLQAALNIEDGIENLRYNNIVIATDADVDGMHIRLLLITFFLQFFPELIKEGHLYILETPLFRVRNKKKTFYCYSEEEKKSAILELNHKVEITRFKGLGEISPDEFQHFIGQDIRLEPVMLDKETTIDDLLRFYMGKNTQDRQQFIIENLRVEDNAVEADS
ncbi:MAG: type IIA DNA topoisomerase subunit B, partial [Flavobacteriales bacterium]|nr:type IIA DNA topoisomerase subunit B [Flavobacteriales bacterium]